MVAKLSKEEQVNRIIKKFETNALRIWNRYPEVRAMKNHNFITLMAIEDFYKRPVRKIKQPVLNCDASVESSLALFFVNKHILEGTIKRVLNLR